MDQRVTTAVNLVTDAPLGHHAAQYDETIALLNSLSANEIPHVNGTLLPHLIGTYELLAKWGNPNELCLAGLCHAVYGTSNFPLQLLTLAQRGQLRAVIGTAAEELVYFYASCERSLVYPQIGVNTPIQYHDRFTATAFVPDDELFKHFLELTFANELELARHDVAFVNHTRESLGKLFARCGAFVSPQAFAFFTEIYGALPSTSAPEIAL